MNIHPPPPPINVLVTSLLTIQRFFFRYKIFLQAENYNINRRGKERLQLNVKLTIYLLNRPDKSNQTVVCKHSLTMMHIVIVKNLRM